MIDLHSYVHDAIRQHGADAMLMDWVHFSPEGAQRVSSWLLPQLVD